ncbi:type II toxin-antitoxin system RelE/ParE family toxin [Pseudidiomarina sp. YC-516-91]|jgi:hypothetical protein|uniref:type II toxin-antitoxin system RelE/ParE family toxin n=1 Tax=Pseudidiomarina salilacus TaxID=3384452 RepID=UPI0039850B90
MIIFKSRWFAKWAAKQGLTDNALIAAVGEMESGLIDADLGGFIFKKRAPTNGQGKRTGIRTIVAFKTNDKAFFVFGFAKNSRANISATELLALKKLASELFSYSTEELQKAIRSGSIIEVK